MLEPLPVSCGVSDLSFLNSCFSMMEGVQPRVTHSKKDSCTVRLFDDSCFCLENDSKLLEPTPIVENSIPYDKSKEDVIRLFASLVAQEKELPFWPSERVHQVSDDESSRNDNQDDHGVVDLDGQTPPLIRSDQTRKWEEIFQHLAHFKRQNGHMCIPRSGKNANQGLVRWVKRQRYQYKLRQQGKKSTMTPARIRALESIGFVWNSHASQWDERLEELQKFRENHGHAKVPLVYPPKKLATWMKRQRREYLHRKQGRPSRMTNDCLAILNSVGFPWNGRDKKE